MKTISIIGAGWLGLPLAGQLLQDGHRVLGTTTRPAKLQDIRDLGMDAYLLDSATAGYQHLAPLMQCDVLVVTVPPRGGEESYAAFLRELAGAARKNGLQKLIYTSTISVYEEKNALVTEEDATMVRSPHSRVRMLAMENIFRDDASLGATVLRLGGLFGPGREPGKWLSGRRNVNGADSPVNVVHLDDCLGTVRAVMERQAWGETFNVVAPLHPSRREFYDRACAALGLEPPHWNDEAQPWKIVSSQKTIDKLIYSFTYHDPMRAL